MAETAEVYVHFMELTEKDRERMNITEGLGSLVFFVKLGMWFQQVFYEDESVFYHVEISVKQTDMKRAGHENVVPNAKKFSLIGFRVTNQGVEIGHKQFSSDSYTKQLIFEVPLYKLKEMICYAIERRKDSEYNRHWYEFLWFPVPDDSREFTCVRFIAMMLKKVGLIEEEVKSGSCWADDIYRLTRGKAQTEGNYHHGQYKIHN